MPFDSVKKVVGIIDNALDLGCGAIRELLGSGDELLIGCIPVNNGILGHLDLGHEVESVLRQGHANGQAFLSRNLRMGEALRPQETGMGIDHVSFAPGGASNRLIKGPVGTGNRIPGIHEQVGLTPL